MRRSSAAESARTAGTHALVAQRQRRSSGSASRVGVAEDIVLFRLYNLHEMHRLLSIRSQNEGRSLRLLRQLHARYAEADGAVEVVANSA